MKFNEFIDTYSEVLRINKFEQDTDYSCRYQFNNKGYTIRIDLIDPEIGRSDIQIFSNDKAQARLYLTLTISDSIFDSINAIIDIFNDMHHTKVPKFVKPKGNTYGE